MNDLNPSPRRPRLADVGPKSSGGMTSPSLREPVRSLAEVVRDLEIKLERVVDPVERQRIERSLGVLRSVLSRRR